MCCCWRPPGLFLDAEILSYPRAVGPAVGVCIRLYVYVAGFWLRIMPNADYDKPVFWGERGSQTHQIYQPAAVGGLAGLWSRRPPFKAQQHELTVGC